MTNFIFLNKSHPPCFVIKTILIVVLLFYTVEPASAADKLTVFVSIAPQKYFVEKIAKGLVDVKVMVPQGERPDTYDPKPSQMAEFFKATLYFAVGAEFEDAWIKKIKEVNPGIEVVYFDQKIEKAPVLTPYHKNQNKNASLTDHHIWLSPPLTISISRMILSSLQRIDPANHLAYGNNNSGLLVELIQLHKKIGQILKDVKGGSIIVSHPAWGYFSRTYGLNQIPIEIQGRELDKAALIQHIKAENIKHIFSQPQFPVREAASVARKSGAKLVYLDPLSHKWAETLLDAAKQFKIALQ